MCSRDDFLLTNEHESSSVRGSGRPAEKSSLPQYIKNTGRVHPRPRELRLITSKVFILSNQYCVVGSYTWSVLIGISLFVRTG